MNETNIKLRVADLTDAPKLLEIYSYYVENTAITFEYEPPTLEEFQNRICTISKRYPYLVAEMEGDVVGYAYAAAFKDRPAYDWAVETTIYVRKDMRVAGIGRKLYDALEKILKEQNILNLNACIAYPHEEDKYLTLDSVKFHEKMGYRMVGEFRKCGYKFQNWYSMVWMEKHIGEHEIPHPDMRSFETLKDRIQEEYGI